MVIENYRKKLSFVSETAVKITNVNYIFAIYVNFKNKNLFLFVAYRKIITSNNDNRISSLI